mmetsp:Transcript_110120/g.322169  ORF Transcript_110120/g.322169 Transcript_110120/m.322169 type:complete len:345 (-) Transcript_110120:372-1406(-)
MELRVHIDLRRHARPHRALGVQLLPDALLAVLLERKRIHGCLQLLMQALVHEVAVHVRLQELRPHQLPGPQLLQVICSDKLVVVKDSLLGALFQLFCHGVQEGAPRRRKPQGRYKVATDAHVVVRCKEEPSARHELHLVERVLRLHRRRQGPRVCIPDLDGPAVGRGHQQLTGIQAPRVERHGADGEPVHMVPLREEFTTSHIIHSDEATGCASSELHATLRVGAAHHLLVRVTVVANVGNLQAPQRLGPFAQVVGLDQAVVPGAAQDRQRWVHGQGVHLAEPLHGQGSEEGPAFQVQPHDLRRGAAHKEAAGLGVVADRAPRLGHAELVVAAVLGVELQAAVL